MRVSVEVIFKGYFVNIKPIIYWISLYKIRDLLHSCMDTSKIILRCTSLEILQMIQNSGDINSLISHQPIFSSKKNGFLNLFFIEVELVYNIILTSGIQHSNLIPAYYHNKATITISLVTIPHHCCPFPNPFPLL